MKRKKDYSREEVEMYLRAIMEKNIKENDLLAEIYPLLDEYFIADFELKNECIIWRMMNDQRFKIII